MSRHKFVYMVVVDAKIRNAFFSCSATYLTKFFTDLFNFSRVPDKLRPNKNDESLSCLDPSSVDQDIPKVNSHHPTFYGAPTVPCIHVFCFISPIYPRCAVTMCWRAPLITKINSPPLFSEIGSRWSYVWIPKVVTTFVVASRGG